MLIYIYIYVDVYAHIYMYYVKSCPYELLFGLGRLSGSNISASPWRQAGAAVATREPQLANERASVERPHFKVRGLYPTRKTLGSLYRVPLKGPRRGYGVTEGLFWGILGVFELGFRPRDFIWGASVGPYLLKGDLN